MRRKGAIGHGKRPTICSAFYLVARSCSHDRLDGNRCSHWKVRPGTRFADIGNIGELVHGVAKTVTGECGNTGKAALFDNMLNGRRDIPHPAPTTDYGDACIQCRMGDMEQMLCFVANRSHTHRCTGIGDDALVRYPAIKRDDITVSKHARTGNTMHNLVVYRRAEGMTVALVTLKCGHPPVIADEGFSKSIELDGRNSCNGFRCQIVKACTEDGTAFAKQFDLRRSKDLTLGHSKSLKLNASH